MVQLGILQASVILEDASLNFRRIAAGQPNREKEETDFLPIWSYLDKTD